MMRGPKPILLWSVPRSVSTAFERAFMQRADTDTLHEPFGDPYYFGPERLSRRYSADKCAASDSRDVTYADVHERIVQTQRRAAAAGAAGDSKFVFVKDMAQYVVPLERVDFQSAASNPSVLSDDDLKEFRHAFLVRTPQKTLESYYRATISSDCREFGDFDPAEAGFAELLALLMAKRLTFPQEYTRRLLPEEPVVLLDSADLLADPEGALRAFCAAVAMPFDPSMLAWNKQHVASFDKWKGWHDQAQNSTGFKEVPRKEIELPQEVLDAIEYNMPIYEYLREMRLKI